MLSLQVAIIIVLAGVLLFKTEIEPRLPMAANSASSSTLGASPSSTSDWRVVDGDTIAQRQTGERVRIANIDTPETGGAACAAERALGDRATAETARLIASAGQVSLQKLGRQDIYGRTLAYVSVDGRDLGAVLIAKGLARPWRGHREPWCRPDGALLATS